MSTLLISMPADRIEWGPVQRVGHSSCFQTATVYRGEELALQLTLRWPTPEPSLAVVCGTDTRHAGPRD